MAKINNIIVLDDAIVFKKCTQDFVCVLVLYILFISISSNERMKNEQMKKKKTMHVVCTVHMAMYMYMCVIIVAPYILYSNVLQHWHSIPINNEL